VPLVSQEGEGWHPAFGFTIMVNYVTLDSNDFPSPAAFGSMTAKLSMRCGLAAANRETGSLGSQSCLLFKLESYMDDLSLFSLSRLLSKLCYNIDCDQKSGRKPGRTTKAPQGAPEWVKWSPTFGHTK
jgi:hypothetical protein